MHAYSWGLDFKEWDRLRECLVGALRFSSSRTVTTTDAESRIASFQGRVDDYAARCHLHCNQLVRVDGDRAAYTGYLMLARVRQPADGGGFFYEGGFYRNTFVREGGSWKASEIIWQDVFSDSGAPMKILHDTLASPITAAKQVLPEGPGTAATEHDAVSAVVNWVIRAADSGDLAAFHEWVDAMANGTVDGQACRGRDALAQAFLAPAGRRLTFLANHRVRVSGDRASYAASAAIVTIGTGQSSSRQAGGILHADLSKSPDGWRLAALRLQILWDTQKATVPAQSPVADCPDLCDDWTGNGIVPDGQRLEDLLHRMLACVDAGDRDGLSRCLADDATGKLWDAEPLRSRAAIVAALLEYRGSLDFLQSFAFNTVVRFEGEQSTLKCYSMARQVSAQGNAPDTVGGRLFMKARHEAGAWQITDLTFCRDFGPFDVPRAPASSIAQS
ncbi:hypothetical protein STA1M1_09150 [Sinisalibacter aestuarii]|uniref:SnoaL-like domain-containing protein n=2 Tax=Sinisalibacter aestuarii TaxID=2949426 RepID=A0ABQ5LPZ7_9RHOB|nr:hypothetical protein STA1M1_09150 [Sinisalibacter aestuarii]